MSFNSRIALVAMLTVALLMVPCLSLIDGFGGGAAHAHVSAYHVDTKSNGQAKDDHHAYADHEDVTHQPGQNENHHSNLDGSPDVCCGLCDGWVVRQDRSPLTIATAVSPAPDPDKAGINLGGSGSEWADILAHSRTAQLTASRQLARTDSSRPYEQTNRYRL